MSKKAIDFYFVDKVNFHKRNFDNFISYVEENHTYEYNNSYPALKGRFGEYYYKNISGLPNFKKYEELYKNLTIKNIVNLEEVKKISYKGYKLWEVSKAELNNYLSAKIYDLYVQGSIKNKEDNEELIEWLIRTYSGDDESLINIVYHNYAIAAFWIDYWPKIFNESSIRNVCVFGGTTIFSKVAATVAHWRNINVIAFEGFFIKKFHYADNSSGVITNNHRGGDNSFWTSIKPLCFLEQQEKWLENEMKNRQNLNVIQPVKVSKDEIYERYNIDKNKKIVLLIGQVINDFSITNDLNTYHSTIDFYSELIRYFTNNKEYHLFIKLHPWENHKKHNIMQITKKSLERKIRNKKYNNFTIDYDVNIETLIEISEFGITSCSQSGLEMLYEGKRVLQVGNAFYGNKGWTYDVLNKDMLNASINSISSDSKLSSEELIEFKKYLYHLMHKNMFLRSGKDDRFIVKIKNICDLTQVHNVNFTKKINDEKKHIEKNKSKSMSDKIIKGIKEPRLILKHINFRINKYRERNYKTVNMVMGHNVQSKIFSDMLGRFEKELKKNKYLMKVSNKPIQNADIYHYWRPNKVEVNEIKHPSISTVHHDLTRDSESLTIRHFIEAYKESNCILCLNNEQKALLRNYLGDDKFIDVIPHGYDIRFKEKAEYKSVIDKDNKLVIGFSSRRYERLIKGEETLYKVIEATKELPIKWIFIGQDRHIEDEFCSKLGVESEVYEKLEYSKYPELYSNMDVFLIASKAEGGPASLPEALATGLTTIATPCGFVCDMIEDEKNGYIVGYDDYEGIIKNIQKLINNPTLLKKIGSDAAKSSKLKDWSSIIRDYIKVYNKLITERKQ